MVNDKARRSVIQFEDVSFEYPGAETESIQHINLDVKEGEFLVSDWRKWLRKDNSDTIDKRVS